MRSRVRTGRAVRAGSLVLALLPLGACGGSSEEVVVKVYSCERVDPNGDHISIAAGVDSDNRLRAVVVRHVDVVVPQASAPGKPQSVDGLFAGMKPKVELIARGKGPAPGIWVDGQRWPHGGDLAVLYASSSGKSIPIDVALDQRQGFAADVLRVCGADPKGHSNQGSVTTPKMLLERWILPQVRSMEAELKK